MKRKDKRKDMGGRRWEDMSLREDRSIWNVLVKGDDINGAKHGIGEEGNGEGARMVRKWFVMFDVRR